MLPETFARVAAQLPRLLELNYYADRQSPWLLAHTMPDAARVADLRAAPIGKLLGRPALRPLVARSGGLLRKGDVRALAYSDAFALMDGISPAAEAALDTIWGQDWMDIEVTYTSWGSDSHDWQWLQTTRPGSGLVVQVSFPSEHARLLGRMPSDTRGTYECAHHPIRRQGRPTLAWARVDLDFNSGAALIEEVQCDWLRLAKRHVDGMRRARTKSRRLAAHDAYYRALVDRYAKAWPHLTMLATLVTLRDLLGLRSIWMHQPDSGAVLKGIYGETPPRSLYTQLPKAFCFEPTPSVPAFLKDRSGGKRPREQNRRLKAARRMIRQGRSIFWRLEL